ncbi:replication initiation negative regulator SeqA [Aliidiomarina taiwanensis]|uniref:Negative modulator of initiation of replication n=1 Tax=Aliidiomarina taiwanensis TaxID=946228 RepID=A0A432XAI2_9GAMM|nr:replication initiation negative regulator SeqA [Aliidiomarina taiwanensis]RUO44330.1 replication initiation negative regulator SeqA [Aliidiomarina taiwanensis]
MKQIEIDAELYRYIASHTQSIGESASDILRRLLALPPLTGIEKEQAVAMEPELAPAQEEAEVEEPPAEEPAPAQSALESVVAEQLDAEKSKVGRFLYLLSVLYQSHPDTFDNVLRIRGRHRLYFAKSKEELKASGNSTNPKEVPNSGYWVVTNSNTSKKQAIVKQAAQELGYSAADADQLKDLL